MNISSQPFGKTQDGTEVTLWRIQNSSGAVAEVLDYGCTVRSLLVPNATGGFTDVCLGYDTVEEYEKHDGYLGAVIGRFANRIADGRFTLDGEEYTLCVNNAKNHLHGGAKGFDKYVWQTTPGEDSLIFTRTSPHMEEGYPGNLSVEVAVAFTEDCSLSFTYRAVSDAKTPVNLTNHAYFHLGGQGAGTIDDHMLTLYAQTFAESDSDCMPTGRLLSVAGTPFDFTVAKPIGLGIHQPHAQLLAVGGGYDHCYILEQKEGMRKVAQVTSPKTGITMTVDTTLPGVQFYSGNFLTTRAGKGGAVYNIHHGFCLETEYMPNYAAFEQFPSPVLLPGQEHYSRTVYSFSVVKG